MKKNLFKVGQFLHLSFTKANVSRITNGLKRYQSSLLFIFIFSLNILGQSPTQTDFDVLPATPTEKQISSSKPHRYKIELKKDEFIQIKVEQKGVDVTLNLLDKNDIVLKTMNSLEGKTGAEILSWIAPNPSNYSLEIIASDKKTDGGNYLVSHKVSPEASPSDRRRVEVENLFMEGIKARATDGQAETAIKKFSEALTGWQELNDQFMADATKLLVVRLTARAKFIDARRLFNGRTVESLRQAFVKFQEAAELYREGGEENNEAGAIFGAGTIAYYLGEKESAINFLIKALNIYQKLGKKLIVAEAAVGIATIYNELDKRTEAIEYFTLALTIYDTFDNQKAASAKMSRNLGLLYHHLYKKQKALEYFKKALPLFQSAGNKTEAAETLNEIATVYLELGEYESALENYKKALEFFAGDESGKAKVKNNIGNVYYNSGKYSEALDSYNQAYNIYLNIQEKPNEAIVLINIGLVHTALGEYDKALSILNEKALELNRKLGDKKSEAYTLNNIGEVYSKREEHSKALDFYQRAASLFITVGEQNGEAIVLGNMMSDLTALNKKRMAIFCGKLSINIFQKLRDEAKGLPAENQKSFLRRLGSYYHNLAELMIKEGQIDQAVEVLNLYQDQQFFDLDFDSASSAQQYILSNREQELSKSYGSFSNSIKQISLQAEKLKRQVDDKYLSEKEEKIRELKNLDIQLTSATNDLINFLKNTEKDLTAPLDNKDVFTKIKDSLEMKESLDFLNNEDGKKHIAVYTLAAQNNLYLLLITPEKNAQGKYVPTKVFSSPVKESDLNIKIETFLKTLRNNNRDPYETGNELYKIIFQAISTDGKKTTLAAELAKYKANVLHWSLDGSLRYIPIAALSDGKKRFVVEKYETAVFTRAEKQGFMRQPQKWEQGLGFGTSEAYEKFSKLTNVPFELKEIFGDGVKKGLLNGRFLLDKDFTEKNMLDAINNASPKSSLIHFSSHFKFVAGDAQSSFLLLGAGNEDERKFSLYDMQKYPNLFQGVDLVTAAACETAGFQADNNGKEIDAFAELAQRLGASSVIATLWKVDDAGTSQLMIDFYRLYSERIEKNSTNMPAKSEILRAAQLNLLKRSQKDKAICVGGAIKSSNDRALTGSEYQGGVAGVESFKAFKLKNPNQPCEHPYFWASFVLYGSPR
jgi:CHAT domain-containing protein/Tfp pilus assembly protein PilF